MKTIHINLEFKSEDFTKLRSALYELFQKFDEIDELYLKTCSVKELKEE